MRRRRAARKKPRQKPRIYASLNRRGEIALSAEAFRQIKQPASVALLYCPVQGVISVKFPVPFDRRFFPARKYGRNGQMRVIRARRLLKEFGVKIEKTLIFNDPQVTRFNGVPMLVLEMGKAGRDKEQANGSSISEGSAALSSRPRRH